MIHLVVGAPGPFTDWCARMAAALLRRAGGDAEVAGASRLEEIGWIALTGAARDTVCYAIAIDDALAHALDAAARGPILAVMDPRAAMLLCLDQPGLSTIEAFRAVLTSAVAMGRAAAHAGALPLSPQACAADPAGAVAALAARLGIDPGPDGAAAERARLQPLLEAAAAAAPDAAALEAAIAAHAGDARLARAMTAALGDYAAVAAGAPCAEIGLHPDLFQTGVAPHDPLRGPVDVTGAARFLFIGGYAPLPVGEWEAEALIDVSETATEGMYAVDVVIHRQGQATVLAQKTLTLAAPGLHRVALAFRLHSIGALVETRLRSERAMFDGVVALVDMRYRRRAAGAPTRT